MAKKDNKNTQEQMVTIAMLAEEFNVEGRDIRVVLRANGFKAPKADTPEGEFGPRAKYQWPEGSKEIEKVRKLIEEHMDASEDEPSPSKKDKKAKAKPEPVEEEDDDEDEDE